MSVDPGGTPTAVTCPSASQCTAVDGQGREVTFNPGARAVDPPGVVTVAASLNLDALSCASATQCTAVDKAGHEVTFNPQTGTVNAAHIQAPGSADSINSFDAVSCTSAAQCTAFGIVALRNSGEPGGGPGDNFGGEVTFDPRTGAVGPHGVQSLDFAFPMFAGACPSPTQCTGVHEVFGWATFNPSTGMVSRNFSTPLKSDGTVDSLSCPSTTQCTGVLSPVGEEVTFNPTSTGLRSDQSLAAASGKKALNSVSCPSTSSCTAVGDAGRAVTFDPVSPSGASWTAVSGSRPLTGISCPTVARCVAVDNAGAAFVGAPPAPPSPATTLRATSVLTRSAVLRGRIQTHGHAVAWQFQYGTGRTYTRSTPVRRTAAGKTRPVVVSWKLGHLRPNTRYHYRLVLVSSPKAGRRSVTAAGGASTFTTRATGRVALLSRQLHVDPRWGFTFVPLRCISPEACRLRFTVTGRVTTVSAGVRQVSTIYCFAGSARIPGGRRGSVKVYIERSCQAAVQGARHHSVGARFAGSTTTGQRVPSESVTVIR